MEEIEWLPDLICLEDFGGNWEEFLEGAYSAFKKDFIDSKPFFRGVRFGLKRHPIEKGKEATFWHMTSEGRTESERAPDLRRCERISWPRPIIDNEGDQNIKVWWNQRGRSKRICLWLEDYEYLVILDDRGDYILPWTAYLVTENHSKRKLQREYEAYCKTQTP